MSNVVRFPGGHRVAAKTIPREEFEQLAELALDVVERIVALLDDRDGEAMDRANDRGLKVEGPHNLRPLADRFGFETNS